MAVIPTEQLTALRNDYERDALAIPEAIPHTKAQANAAHQAVEDGFPGAVATLRDAIEAAVPAVYTNAQKNRIIRRCLLRRI